MNKMELIQMLLEQQKQKEVVPELPENILGEIQPAPLAIEQEIDPETGLPRERKKNPDEDLFRQATIPTPIIGGY